MFSKKKDTKKSTKKVEAKAPVKAEATTKKPVNLDKMVEKKKTSGTEFQAYIRDCMKAGKLL